MGTIPEYLQEPLKGARSSLESGRWRGGGGVLASGRDRPVSCITPWLNGLREPKLQPPNPTSACPELIKMFGCLAHAGTAFLGEIIPQ